MRKKPKAARPDTRWTFLTNHAHVLICVAADPYAPMREFARRVGITERAVQRIVAELADGGLLTVARVGRRNAYTVNPGAPLRGPLVGHRSAGDLINLGLGGKPKGQ